MVLQPKHGAAYPREGTAMEVSAYRSQNVSPGAAPSLTLGLWAIGLPVAGPRRFEVRPPRRESVNRSSRTRCEQFSGLLDLSQGFATDLDALANPEHPIRGAVEECRLGDPRGPDQGQGAWFGLPVGPAAHGGSSDWRDSTQVKCEIASPVEKISYHCRALTTQEPVVTVLVRNQMAGQNRLHAE
jgi:hypothetical protein